MPKTLKTTKENKTWTNIQSIDLKTLSVKENKALITKAKKWKLPGYHVVKKKDNTEFLRSNPNRTKKDNLDPKIKKSPKKKKPKKK